ncbi:MAG TPA: hypothetical protein VKA89_11395, partial [Solirubrobacterales bacterium]|nr:hypothetical protein [Solirubrobacterales bacterium]
MSLRERRLKARRRRNAVAGSMAIGAVLAAPATADAATFTVSNLADSGGGSLRDALAQANSDPESADDIVFQSGLSGQITLSSSLNVLSRVDIHGPGANVITVSGNDATRVFDVGLGDRQASISGLTITDGATGSGGGIFHEGGTLIVSDSVISGSEADEGGGIFFQGQNDNSRLVVQRSTISGNAAGASGGGGISGLV